MRVTQKLLFGNFMRDVNKNRSEAGRIQSDLSSGRSVRVASQAPVPFQRSRILEENIRKEEQYQSNLDSGLRQGRLAQDTLDKMIDSLIEIKETTVKGASDSYGEENRVSMADQVKGIKVTLANALNLTYGDRYLFAGTNSDQAPFEVDGAGNVTNNSNANPPVIKAGDGVSIKFSVTGQELTTTPAGDMFTILGDIEQALINNDGAALNQLLTDVQDVIEHVTDKTSQLGNNINRMEYMFEQYESSKISQEADISGLVDTDYAQAFSDMQRNQVAYESAMAVHTTMFSNTLLDYL
ncbi:flagellin [Gracilimonas mengyeensis]|uniref:Flagellin n=1 Tax=Gracilimonas mengyeensis TaxID=1302730 RepID=A0A521FID1_9BACT|nr:flagellin [Gracilimonas mengyeensis]SMO95849.1 flagellin C-terminal helical region [Gracilimonas mengyeensis]